MLVVLVAKIGANFSLLSVKNERTLNRDDVTVRWHRYCKRQELPFFVPYWRNEGKNRFFPCFPTMGRLH